MVQPEKWHEVVNKKSIELLSDILDDDVIFYSPILFKPQKGKQLTMMYLMGAMHILLNGSFNYTNEAHASNYSVFEFEVVVDQIQINGVDIITWNEEGKIVQFKVMLRPYSGVNMLKQKMAELLETMK